MSRRKVVILGAARRDFHNFNTVYRNDPQFEVAFTATQIPIRGRMQSARSGRRTPNTRPRPASCRRWAMATSRSASWKRRSVARRRMVVGTPIDLTRVLKLDRPAPPVRYELREKNPGAIERAIRTALERTAPAHA